MKGISAAFWAESLKIRRSKMLWITILAALFMAGMMGFLMFIAKNPELASKMGILGTKSSIMGNVDWPSYLGLLIEMISALGLMGFGFVVNWVFGREYSDRTVKDLLALPIPRSFIVLSKFMVVVIWSALLAFILLVFALVVGGMIGLTGWSGGIAPSRRLRIRGNHPTDHIIMYARCFFCQLRPRVFASHRFRHSHSNYSAIYRGIKLRTVFPLGDPGTIQCCGGRGRSATGSG